MHGLHLHGSTHRSSSILIFTPSHLHPSSLNHPTTAAQRAAPGLAAPWLMPSAMATHRTSELPRKVGIQMHVHNQKSSQLRAWMSDQWNWNSDRSVWPVASTCGWVTRRTWPGGPGKSGTSPGVQRGARAGGGGGGASAVIVSMMGCRCINALERNRPSSHCLENKQQWNHHVVAEGLECQSAVPGASRM